MPANFPEATTVPTNLPKPIHRVPSKMSKLNGTKEIENPKEAWELLLSESPTITWDAAVFKLPEELQRVASLPLIDLEPVTPRSHSTPPSSWSPVASHRHSLSDILLTDDPEETGLHFPPGNDMLIFRSKFQEPKSLIELCSDADEDTPNNESPRGYKFEL
jgi:hypothetical protein